MTAATTCQSCRYWLNDRNDLGCCLRKSPQFVIRGQAYTTTWPHTHQDNWCGEWEARP